MTETSEMEEFRTREAALKWIKAFGAKESQRDKYYDRSQAVRDEWGNKQPMNTDWMTKRHRRGATYGPQQRVRDPSTNSQKKAAKRKKVVAGKQAKKKKRAPDSIKPKKVTVQQSSIKGAGMGLFLMEDAGDDEYIA